MKTVFHASGFFLFVLVCFNSLKAQNTFPAEGNAGIGTTVPAANLEIKASQANALMLDAYGAGPGKTSELRFRELKSNGNNFTGFKAPDNVPANVTWTLPGGDGTNGQYLSTDGAGNLVWKSPTVDANRFLSNLAAPTKFNQSLLPDQNNIRDIGSSEKTWRNFYFTGNLYAGQTRVFSLAGGKNTFVGMSAGANNGGNDNTFMGEKAGFNNTSGDANNADGSFAFYSNTTGSNNAAFGASALYNNISGFANVAVGYSALYSNTTGYNNVANGNSALFSNTSGFENSAFGLCAMNGNTSGFFNTAVGNYALKTNSTGIKNVASGYQALFYNTGNSNVADGYQALYSNTNGSNNTASGSSALYFNTTGENNVAVGSEALYSSNGSSNTATGHQALYSNSGSQNTGTGYQALHANTTGDYNTADGYGAGSLNDNSSYCTFLGYDADQASSSDFSNGTVIGWGARLTASDQIRIGNTTITSIGGYTNWSNLSDGRFKKEIKEDVPGLEFINKLRPVTYHLDVTGLRTYLGEDKSDNADVKQTASSDDATISEAINQKEKIVYSGFVAQEVEAAAKEVGYDFSGVDAPKNENDLYGLRYTEFVVPLVKAVQELSLQEEKEKTANASQDIEVEKLEAEIEELKTEISDLKSAMLNLSSPVGQKSTSSDQSRRGELGQNFPNPFDKSTIIPFTLSENCQSAYITISESSTGRIILLTPVACNQTFITLESGTIAAGLYNYSLYVDQAMIGTRQMLITR